MNDALIWSTALWVAAIVLLFFARAKALVWVFAINLALIHLVAGVMYLSHGPVLYPARLVAEGYQLSAYGITAFAVAALVISKRSVHSARTQQRLKEFRNKRTRDKCLLIGAVSIALLYSATVFIPSLTAIVASGEQLFLTGLCLAWWEGRRRKRFLQCAGVLCIALFFPLLTLLAAGFLAFGTAAAVVIMVFAATVSRSRLRVAIATVVLGYLGATVFVSYLRDRTAIRGVVWGGGTVGERVSAVSNTVATFEWFDPTNPAHLKRIDSRLDQNYLVGLAVNSLSMSDAYARGGTLWQAIVALVPRILWRDKPVTAGGSEMVTRYTGLYFPNGTSVGMGPVMELYINFGSLGVVIGFFALGLLVASLDQRAWQGLLEDDWERFALSFTVGISFLQVGGSFAEMVGTAGASLVLLRVVNQWKSPRVTVPGRVLPANGFSAGPYRY
jgi:hypothetical protein